MSSEYLPEFASPEFIEYNRLYREFNNIYHDVALRLNMSDSAFEILYAICDLGDGCLQKDICNLTFLSKQTVNSSIDKLIDKDFITLTRGRGRNMHIHLTPDGRSLIENKIYPVMRIENDAFSVLDKDEIKQLLMLHNKYITALHSGMAKLTDNHDKEDL